MNVPKKPTFLGRIVQHTHILAGVFLLVCFGLLAFLFYVQKIKNYDINLLSPVGVRKIILSRDPFYEKVLHSRTIDHFPPNRYFPLHLIPRFTLTKDLPAWGYAVMDRDTRELLYGKNLTGRLPLASLAKVMTSIVAIEKAPFDLLTTVSLSAAQVGEASMGLSSGEKVTIEELLYGSMLPSGNDASEVLSESVGKYMLGIGQEVTDGGVARKTFLNSMNEKAQALGMFDTYFFNPTGLDEEEKEKSSFSTVLDLLALTNYALGNETFAKIVETSFVQFPYKDGYHKAFYLQNILSLSQAFDGIKGVKPGNSIFAKETLISYIERDGRRLITVILGSNHTRDDVLTIYKQIFPESASKAKIVKK
ncbi:D-alanyl-D-alanine carboxypeptidase [Candidatus Gottesmanbacteria bacterium]|nr:D-alanyl-D-alanine carboxypeptidase [Candidatus Gottesmanbacteria bacterium]